VTNEAVEPEARRDGTRVEDPGQTIVLSVSAAFWRKLQRGVDQCLFREGEERAARETARLLQLAAGL